MNVKRVIEVCAQQGFEIVEDAKVVQVRDYDGRLACVFSAALESQGWRNVLSTMQRAGLIWPGA